LWLWRQSRPLAGSIGEVYLREPRKYQGPLPETLRFLPSQRDYPATLIGVFAVARETMTNEPDATLIVEDHLIRGVHLTRLLPDGSDRERSEQAKVMIGRSKGTPLILAPLTDLCGLAIAKTKKLAPQTITALKALKEAIAELGSVPPASNHIPAGVSCLSRDQWRDYANRMGICTTAGREAKTPDEAEKLLKEAQRKAFGRASTELIGADKVGCWNDFVWFASSSPKNGHGQIADRHRTCPRTKRTGQDGVL
jgi:hypothetical protein